MWCINAEQLRKALKEIEIAERNGFDCCLAVFVPTSAGRALDQCKLEYSDLVERAHPTRCHNWGRGQNITKRFRFASGHLVKIDKEEG